MVDTAENADIVGLLRGRAEEADLRLFLKSSLGGYTRKSVLEYLALLRTRQQSAAEIFDQNLKSLFAEKEKLKTDNAALKEQLLKTQTEFKKLSESLHGPLSSCPEAGDDPEKLRGVAAALENELRHVSAERDSLRREGEELRASISQLGKNLEQAVRDTRAGEALLRREREGAQAQRDQILELVAAAEEQRNKIKLLESQLSEESITKLQSEISELNAQLRAKSEVICAQNADLASRDEAIGTLENENKLLKLNTEYLSKSLETSALQNEKLSAANRDLLDKLKEGYQKSIESIHERAELSVEKIIASRRLEEANAKIASLQYQLEGKAAREEELAQMRKNCG